MRSLWKGSISFGLVNIPVKMYTATESKSVKFNYLHRECHTPVKYQKVCPSCQEEIGSEDIVRGYEYQKNHYVVIEDDDLEAVMPKVETRSISIVDFVNLEQIDPIYYHKSYFLEPSEGGRKAYYLLRRAMEETDRIAIAKVVLRSKENLAAMRIYRDGLLLETMLYPDEIRSLEQLPGLGQEPEITDTELKMAVDLIGNLSDKFEPEKYKDRYREELLDLIEKKIAGQEVKRAPEPAAAGKVIDLMAALEESIKATRDRRDKEAEEEPKRVKAESKRTKAKSKKTKTG